MSIRGVLLRPGLDKCTRWRQTITATPRQLESLIRISEALARMRLSPTVERQDAAEALRLMQVRPFIVSSSLLLSGEHIILLVIRPQVDQPCWPLTWRSKGR